MLKSPLRLSLPLLLVAVLVSLAACLIPPSLNSGETFPEVLLPAPHDPAQRAYLGLEDERPFSLRQVTGQVVLVEILNVYCPQCRRQTRPYNELYRMIEADPETQGRIMILGVAVANDDVAIAKFVEHYRVAFPVVSDRNFELHRALRAGRTPLTLYVLRDNPGDLGVIAGTHLGGDHDMETRFAQLKGLLNSTSRDLVLQTSSTQEPAEALVPPQSRTEVEQMVERAFAAQGEELKDFRLLALRSGRWVYSASIVRDGRRQPLFAEIASRSAICDACHSVHFFYLFDAAGSVLDFVPLHLTKHGNVAWDRADIEHFASRVVGKRLAGSWSFDDRVDAVTSATMTAAIIFDDLRRGQELFKELRREGHLE